MALSNRTCHSLGQKFGKHLWKRPHMPRKAGREQERVRESSRNTLMAKICLAFCSLCCTRVILGWNVRRGFVSKVKGDGENQESSEQGEGTTGSSCSSFPLDSWDHPGPTEQISFQDKLSRRRQQVGAAQTTLHTPLRGSTTQLRAGGEGIQPGAVGSASGHASQVCQHQTTVRAGAQTGQRSS